MEAVNHPLNPKFYHNSVDHTLHENGYWTLQLDEKIIRLTDQQYILWSKFDGRSLSEVLSDFEGLFQNPPPYGAITQFVHKLSSMGFLYSETEKEPASCATTFTPSRKRSFQIASAKPSLLLRHLYSKMPLSVPKLVFPALIIIALSSLVGWFVGVPDEINIPTSISISLLAVSIMCHELGHFIMMLAFGVQPGKMGVGLKYIVFPYFYVDTKNALLLCRKERILVSVAGPLFGIALSSALYLLSIVLLPSVSRVTWSFHLWNVYLNVLNLFPFLFKLDGYYILSDLAGELSLEKAVCDSFRGKRRVSPLVHVWFVGKIITFTWVVVHLLPKLYAAFQRFW